VLKPDERLLAQDLLGHIWFGGDRDTSTISMNIATNNSILNEESSNSNGCITNNIDMANKEDAVVPNFECE